MQEFQLPADLRFNRGAIADPVAYFRERECNAWLFLVGEEFAQMPNGMSYAQVQAATSTCMNVISDPPRVMNLDLAMQHVKALDALPRPTLISCRMGPRSSAVAYMYAGLRSGADSEAVIAAGERDDAPFAQQEELKQWVRDAMQALRETEL